LRPDEKSLAALRKALAQVGSVTELPLRAFDGNRAFAWKPSEAVTPVDQAAWVFVYDRKRAYMLQVLCTDSTDKTPDTPCAIAGAKQAFTNIT